MAVTAETRTAVSTGQFRTTGTSMDKKADLVIAENIGEVFRKVVLEES